MKTIFLSFLMFLAPFQLVAEKKTQTICLNMIVKNEEKVIARCLESVKDFIDHWVILDTGSTDKTKEVIEKTLQGIPGKLYEKPFENFGKTRNEALTLAKGKCDYILLMDADDTLVFNWDYKKPFLDKDAYKITNKNDNKTRHRTQLIKDNLKWSWKGVIDEEIVCTTGSTQGILPSITNECHNDGYRSSDPDKHYKDIKMLEDALSLDPANIHYIYQLAKSYKSVANYRKAVENFQKVLSLKISDEEVYLTRLEVAKLLQEMGAQPLDVINAYSEAHRASPDRAEPLYYLANYYLQRKEFVLANIVSEYGKSIVKPFDESALEVEDWIYNHGINMICADSAFFSEKYNKAYETCLQLLSQKSLPEDARKKLESNLPLIRSRLVEQKKKSKEADVYLLTMMKSGTHLMDKFLRLLLAKDDREYQYAKTSGKNQPIRSLITSMNDYRIRFCHIPKDKNTPLYHQLYDRKKILLIRDPRDVIISGSHFIPKIFELSQRSSPPVWAVNYVSHAGTFLKKWDKLPLSQRLESMIERKVPDKLYKFTPKSYQENPDEELPPFNIAEQITVAAEYTHSPNTLVIRFEDLVGPKGGGSKQAQYKCMEAIADYIGVPFNQKIYAKIAKDLYGSSYTFRSGKKSSWETTFSTKHKKLFKEEYGQDIISMGYEKNENW